MKNYWLQLDKPYAVNGVDIGDSQPIHTACAIYCSRLIRPCIFPLIPSR